MGPSSIDRYSKQEIASSPFVVTFRSDVIRKCYGCEGDLSAQKEPPHDILLSKKDFRVYKKDGKWHHQMFLSYTYYDLQISCLRKRYPATQISDIVVHDEQQLRDGHIKKLHKFGIHKRCSNCNRM